MTISSHGISPLQPDLLTYLGLLQLEHRPSTIPLQHTRFWAASHAPFQLSFWALSSASVSRLQLLQGRTLPLGIPTQSLSCYVGWWFPQRMAYPAPLPLEDLSGQRFLPCSFPQVSVAYSVWPSDAKDTAKTGVLQPEMNNNAGFVLTKIVKWLFLSLKPLAELSC